ncbi:RNA-directed DNA polymerase, eukaryota, reverse transcriptase zinc-binding domain protein [Tanacetum coccineum]
MAPAGDGFSDELAGSDGFSGEIADCRLQELFVWSPSFKDVPEKELFSDDESAKINEQANNLNNDTRWRMLGSWFRINTFADNGEVKGFRSINMAIEGDENYKYFHAIINKKRSNLSVKDPGVPRRAVWGCGVDKSPGPDGFTFEFFRKYWTVVGPDFCIAVKWFFDHGGFAIGCNSSFVALIPKILLIEVVSEYVHQFTWKPLQRWDYLDDVLISFGFGPKWRSWIRGSLSSGKASILVNGSPTTEFHLYRGLKQGDPLAPFLFLLIMESLHLSFSRAVEAGIFKGYKIDPSTTVGLIDFYAKSHLLECRISQLIVVAEAAKSIGCFDIERLLLNTWDVRSMLDEAFLPKMEVPTRWIKSIPIKVNVFAWKLYLNRLPTRSNLSRRNALLPSLACPLCDHVLEDSSHLFFGCSVAKDIQKLICRWWNLDVHPYESYEDWLSWFKSIRLDKFSAKELWTVCKQYRTVVDAFIPDRRSKAGKRFNFVRFIKIFDVDLPPKDLYKESRENVNSKSYAHVVNAGPHQFHKKEDSPAAIVLDGKVTRIDIEGIPLKVWSKNTFSRITSKWGELLDFDEQEDGYLYSKRVCIKTTLVENIYESFKVIIQGLRITPNVEGESDLEEVAEIIFEKEQDFIEVKEELREKKMLMGLLDYSSQSWEWRCINGVILMKSVHKMKGSGPLFNAHGVDAFNLFISSAGLEEVPLDCCKFTWCHKSGSKMSKLDRFLISEGLLNSCPNISSITLDRYLSYHRPILFCCRWIESPILVKDEFLSYFASRFNKPPDYRLHIDLDFPNKLSLEQQMVLEIEVTREEIKKAVWDCGVDKSPGPDGFTFGFYRRYWTFLENDVVEAVLYFFNHGQFPKGSNSSFITLIPKTQEAKMMKDFRPITLIGSLYKIIAKILANRLVVVLEDLVSDVQSAFVAKRQILDGPFILNELFQWCKMKKKHTDCYLVSHLFYADDAVFMGHWSEANIDTILRVDQAAKKIGCAILQVPFSYLGSKVGCLMSRIQSFVAIIPYVLIQSSSEDEKIGKHVRSHHPSLWLDIVKEVQHIQRQGTDLMGFIHRKMGNGVDIRFWEDKWRGDNTFQSDFPRMYALETQKNISVALKLSHDDLLCSFRRAPRAGAEELQYIQLVKIMEGITLFDSKDRWRWSLEGCGEFTVASVRNLLDANSLPVVSSKTRWIKVVSIKVNIQLVKVSWIYHTG